MPEWLASELRQLPERQRRRILEWLAGVEDLDKFKPPPVKAIEPADLYRIPFWVVTKAFYTVAPIALLFRLATLRGTIDFFCSPDRAQVLETLERQLGATTNSAELRRIARRHFQFRRRLRLAELWPLIRDFADADRIEVEGLHHLDEALAGGKGAILVSAHFGYGRLIKPILNSRGRSALLVGATRSHAPRLALLAGGLSSAPVFSRFAGFVHNRVLRLPRWAREDERWRRTVGEDLASGINLRPHLAALRRNETLIILMDGRLAQHLAPVRVLGIDVPFAPGAASVARATGASLLPTFVVDDVDVKGSIALRLVIHPPLDLETTADPNSDLAVNRERFAAAFEMQACRHPHNWFWGAVRDGVLDVRLTGPPAVAPLSTR